MKRKETKVIELRDRSEENLYDFKQTLHRSPSENDKSNSELSSARKRFEKRTR